jgi:V/A-type H+-transporting ATPase subunit I
MFRPSPMEKVLLLVLKSDLPSVSRALAREKILHLRPVAMKELPSPAPAESDPSTERLRAFSALAEDLSKTLCIEEVRGFEFPSPVEELSLWENWAAQLGERCRRIEDRKAEVSRWLERLTQLEAFLIPLAGIDGDFFELRSLRHARLLMGTLPASAARKLDSTRMPAMLFPFRQTERETTIAVLTSRSRSETVKKNLAGMDFRPLPLPCTLSGSFEPVLERVRQARHRIFAYLANLDGRLAGLREEHRQHLAARLQAVSAELYLRGVEGAFGFTRRVVVLSGWLPQSRDRELKSILDRVCPDRFFLRRSVASGDETPVQLSNPPLLRPFQKVLAIYGTPLYGEVEPTPILGFGFLVLFGMMFGDVGQGLVLLGTGLWMKGFTRFAEEGLLLAEVGGAATIFGFLFGSVFGVENLLPALWFSPFHNIPYLMTSALFLGIVLISSGLFLRIRNLVGRASFTEILTDRFGIAGAVFYLGSVATLLPVYLELVPAMSLLWLLAPLGCIFCHPLVAADRKAGLSLPLLLAEGAIEVMETILGYLVNTFSFLRVGAFGLAHFGLFLAVFTLADQVRDFPLGSLWAAVVYFLGNLVILVLEGLIVSIQAVRLQFYEFFSKFFQGGGIPYRPLVLESSTERRK